MNKKIYGWIIINKQTGELAGTKSTVFETKNAAGAGFYQWTKRMYYDNEYNIKGKKLSEQDVYEVKPLVLADE